jgi:hypothetical protein
MNDGGKNKEGQTFVTPPGAPLKPPAKFKFNAGPTAAVSIPLLPVIYII